MQTNYKYFKFNDGKYFRLDEIEYRFQSLNTGNLWADNYVLERLYEDAASEYTEITDLEVIKKLDAIKTKKEAELSEITISDYETRIPNSNRNYFNKLNGDKQQEYLNLYIFYYDLLYKYLIKKLELKKYDDMLVNSKNIFYIVDKENMDLYQRIGSTYLNYFYIRNNLYIERLSKEELEFLKRKLASENYSLDEETLKFIENTYQKVMLENNNQEVVDINYGPDSFNFYKPNNAIIIGVRFNNYYKPIQESEEKWNQRYNDQLYELEIIMKFLDKKLKNFEVPCSVIVYNDFSVKKLLSNNKTIK